MSLPDDLYLQPEQFSGIVRVFPLPNLVLFPHVLQPLHIFELRYRELLAAALDDDQLIAMALPAPGWEADYEGRPELLPMACLGRIANSQRLDDGRYNILLAGLERVQLVEELPADQLYRRFRAELCPDILSTECSTARDRLHSQLMAALKRALPQMPAVFEQLEQVLSTQISLGTLTDILGYTLDLPFETKLALLAERDVDERGRLLLTQMSGGESSGITAPGLRFPPDFSAN
jgi:Lon protease-like protein